MKENILVKIESYENGCLKTIALLLDKRFVQITSKSVTLYHINVNLFNPTLLTNIINNVGNEAQFTDNDKMILTIDKSQCSVKLINDNDEDKILYLSENIKTMSKELNTLLKEKNELP